MCVIICYQVYKVFFAGSRSLDGISRYRSVNLWMKRALIFLNRTSLVLHEIGQESGPSGEETVGLISRLLDSKLDKKFADFKRALEQKHLSTNFQIKKLKTEAKASSSFQFKADKLQFEFSSSLLGFRSPPRGRFVRC